MSEDVYVIVECVRQTPTNLWVKLTDIASDLTSVADETQRGEIIEPEQVSEDQIVIESICDPLNTIPHKVVLDEQQIYNSSQIVAVYGGGQHTQINSSSQIVSVYDGGQHTQTTEDNLTADVYVSNIDSQGTFCVQLAENYQTISDMESEMCENEMNVKYDLGDPPIFGQLYAAKNYSRGNFYFFFATETFY